MSRRQRLIEALITLLGDEDRSIVQEARKKMLTMGQSIVPQLKEDLSSHPLHLRIRLRQVIHWLDTDPQRKSLPPVTSR